MHWIAPSEKDSASSSLEKRLWDAADQFRANSGLKAQEYSGPILGLIFLRFAEFRFTLQHSRLEAAVASSRRGSRVDEPAAYQAEGILYLAPEARFDYLLTLPEAADIGARVNDAMREIEKHNPQLAGVLPKTYNLFTSTLLKELLKKVSEIPMYDKVKVHWAAETARVQKELGELHYRPHPGGYGMTPGQARRDLGMAELKQRLEVLTSTDMAVVVSPGQNEIQQMQKLGLDIAPHRKRMNESQPGLDEKFKDTEDPLRLVFVCAMWLTGFDAPSCSTVYLDKPMRNHTLMQTIARANRVFPGKHNGVIVDYANVFASLEKALAIYGAGQDGESPVRNKQQLVEELRKSVADATAFCVAHGVTLAGIEATPVGSMERLSRIEDGMNALISPDPLRRDFFAHERLVSTLYRAVKPDPSALDFASKVACLSAIADAIRARLNPSQPDISHVIGRINGLLNESITGLKIRQEIPALDLSKINFEALAKRFEKSRHKNTELEVLKAGIRARLEKMILLNRTRADFAEKFEALIEGYNAGSATIEALYNELLKLSNSLDDEQQRHVRENMSEEELVIFDILTRPAPELSSEERAEVKKVARELLARLKGLLVLNWRQKSMACSQLKLTIEDTLDSGLPRAYTQELYNRKCSVLFEHVYERYPERNAGVYA